MNIKYYIRKILQKKTSNNEKSENKHNLDNKKYYRLHYINYQNIGTLYGFNEGHDVYEQVFKTFMLPEQMGRKEALKVLSYLTDFIEKKFEIEQASLSSVKTLDSIIDLERYGFKRVDFEPSEDMIIDLFTIKGRTRKFKKSKHYQKYFDWYIPKVKKEEVERIYKKYGMTFSDIIFIEEPTKKEPDVIIKKGMKKFEKETDKTTDNITQKNNPLKIIPETKMKIYAFFGTSNSHFFNTEEELEEYKRNEDTSFCIFSTIEYIEEMAGRKDVFKITTEDGKILYYTIIDGMGYAIYNERKSIEEGRFVWEYEYGDLKEIYKEFKKRGINFENDIYEQEEQIYSSFEEHKKKLIKEKE